MSPPFFSSISLLEYFYDLLASHPTNGAPAILDRYCTAVANTHVATRNECMRLLRTPTNHTFLVTLCLGLPASNFNRYRVNNCSLSVLNFKFGPRWPGADRIWYNENGNNDIDGKNDNSMTTELFAPLVPEEVSGFELMDASELIRKLRMKDENLVPPRS